MYAPEHGTHVRIQRGRGPGKPLGYRVSCRVWRGGPASRQWQVLCLLGAVLVVATLIQHRQTPGNNLSPGGAAPLPTDPAAASLEELVQLVHAQNITLAALKSHLAQALQQQEQQILVGHGHNHDDIPGTLPGGDAGHEGQPLHRPHGPEKSGDALQGPTPQQAEGIQWAAAASASVTLSPGEPPRTALQEECYNRFSLGLLERWKGTKEVFCQGGQEHGLESSLECYPLQHDDGRGGKKKKKKKTAMFCEGRNVFVDFSGVQGEKSATKPARGNAMYHTFRRGTTSATCTKTKAFDHSLFMPHHKPMMETFRSGVPPPASYRTISTPTYLLARDEDCENAFHSMADHLNMFMVVSMLGLDVRELQVVLFDRLPDFAFKDLIQRAFSPSHPLKRAKDYPPGPVLFERLVFHLESPGSIIFPGMMDPMRCKGSELWHGFRRHILQAFGLWDVPPPPIPKVVLSVRRRTPAKNVGRILANEGQLVEVLRKGNMMQFEVVDLAVMSLEEQLTTLRSTSILVGVHGAGLMNAMFLAEEAVLLELHPPYRLDRHFRVAARLTDKIYMPYRGTNLGAITCKGSSDSIAVPPKDFEAVMDGALRLARSFDNGHSECGLQCNPRLLALDGGNDPHYGQTFPREGRGSGEATKVVQPAHKAARPSTKFPCNG